MSQFSIFFCLYQSQKVHNSIYLLIRFFMIKLKNRPKFLALHFFKFRLRKFRMPLENAFLTITKDATSKYYHVMSQGTADLLLNACTYVWCEDSLAPYTPNLHKRVLDFYQRNTMTGFVQLAFFLD